MKTLLTAATLSFAALTAPAFAFDLNAMSETERAAFREEIRAYLMENPEVIMEAVAVLEQRQADQQAKGDVDMVRINASDIFEDGYSWVGGNPDGDVTLVEFIDYRCGYCRKAHDEVSQLIETDGNIRFIVKEFPILGEQSVLSSRFAIATKMVAGDAAYKQIHDALITFKGNVAEASLQRLADGLGLDGAAILAKMDDPEINDVIAKNHQLAGRLQISGTPTFVMGEQLVRGYVPLDSMMSIVADIRGQ